MTRMQLKQSDIVTSGRKSYRNCIIDVSHVDFILIHLHRIKFSGESVFVLELFIVHLNFASFLYHEHNNKKAFSADWKVAALFYNQKISKKSEKKKSNLNLNKFCDNIILISSVGICESFYGIGNLYFKFSFKS